MNYENNFYEIQVNRGIFDQLFTLTDFYLL